MMKMMMMFITRRGEGQAKTKNEKKATKSEGSGLQEVASRNVWNMKVVLSVDPEFRPWCRSLRKIILYR